MMPSTIWVTSLGLLPSNRSGMMISSAPAAIPHHNAEGIGHSYGMAKDIEDATGIETRASILGYVQRGGNPTAQDRVHASFMSALAVDLLCAGATNRVVGFRNGQYVDYDIDEALSMVKDVDEYEYQISRMLGRSVYTLQ